MLTWFAILMDAKHWLFAMCAGLVSILIVTRQKKSALVGFLLGLIMSGIRFQLQHSIELEIDTSTSAELVFEITSDPQEVSERFAGLLEFKRDLYVYADAKLNRKSLPVALTIDNFDDDLKKALPSTIWRCRMKLQTAEMNRRYVAYATCIDKPKKVLAPTRLQSMAGIFRNSLQELTYKRNDSDGAALLPGLVVGDNQAQSDDIVQSLRVSGLGHLTAVSGANVAILLLFVQFLLQRTQLSDKWRFLILLIVLVAFVVVARPSPSVVRAAFMAAITLLYWIKGFQKLSESILFLAVSALLLVDPWLAISWGFALSVSATLGLILLPRAWGIDSDSATYMKLGITAFAASLATAPLLLAMGSPVTFATIPANVLAEFLIAPATVLGLIAPLVNFIPGLGWLAHILANLAIGCASVIVLVAEMFSNSIFAISVFSIKGLLLTLVIAAGVKFRRNYKRLLMLALVAVLLLISTNRMESRWRIPDWEIAVCDIGQGDATLIRTSENSVIVVDAGPDASLMRKCLSDFAINKVDLFVASHFHADHVGGIRGLIDIAKPSRVITAALVAPNSGVGLVDRAIFPLIREVANVGMNGSFNKSNYQVFWQVLAPVDVPNFVDDSNGSLINNNSVVLLVTTNHHQVLLTGDIEIDGQNNLMQSLSSPEVDLVKVPHHGSAYQAPEFASWISAQLAWISVSADNDYGHPNPTTIGMYQAAGSIVLSTKDCGHISIGASGFSTSQPCV